MEHGPVSDGFADHGPVSRGSRSSDPRAGKPRIVSPEEFTAHFLEVAKSREPAIKAAWSDGPGLTLLALNEKNGLLATVAQRLNLQCCREYYGIDFVMCEQLDTDHFPPTKGWWVAERIGVAIEHENRVWGATQEMNRLAIYNAPLKVLITYPWKEDASGYLAAYAKILERADTFGDFTSKRRHLVLLASWRSNHVSWESYVYRRG